VVGTVSVCARIGAATVWGVSGLQSMLVPLETLSGWPAVPNPSVLNFLALLIGVPLVLGLVIAGVSYLGSTRELKKFGPAVNPNTAFAGAPGVEHASGEVQAGIEAKPGADAGTGGTSARW
jgi:hypothetical protein